MKTGRDGGEHRHDHYRGTEHSHGRSGGTGRTARRRRPGRDGGHGSGSGPHPTTAAESTAAAARQLGPEVDGKEDRSVGGMCVSCSMLMTFPHLFSNLL